MKEINVFSISGESKSSSSFLEGTDLRERFHSHSVFEAVNIENQNRRQATRKTKTKAEVSGTGKKPYKQKHTGRARQGSRRNPQYRGGGVAFGPTPERNFKIRVNKKVVKLALLSAWLKVMKGENVSILDDSFSNLKKAKSKEFSLFLKKANLLENKILLIIDGSHKNLYLSARNISNVYVRTVEHYSVRDLLNQNYLLLDSSAVPKILDSLGIGKDKE